MCNEDKILHHTKNGKVIWCPHCDSMQLDYKIVQLSFQSVHLSQFLEKIEADLEEAELLNRSDVNFQFATPVKSIQLKFTKAELIELQDLVSISLLQRSLKKMFIDASA
ncbi:MAG: DUF6686 family protein [Chitinophagales bacterium]